MFSSIFKEVYRGSGIYWHPRARCYGDETNPCYGARIADARAAIDAQIAKVEAAAPPEDKFWATLTREERTRWRHEYNRLPEAEAEKYPCVACYAMAHSNSNRS